MIEFRRRCSCRRTPALGAALLTPGIANQPRFAPARASAPQGSRPLLDVGSPQTTPAPRRRTGDANATTQAATLELAPTTWTTPEAGRERGRNYFRSVEGRTRCAGRRPSRCRPASICGCRMENDLRPNGAVSGWVPYCTRGSGTRGTANRLVSHTAGREAHPGNGSTAASDRRPTAAR